jgi:hypothetical protein
MIITPSGKKVHFGQEGYSDYTKHKDSERKERYIARHGGNKSGTKSSKEDWTKSGLDTAGFWSRYLLWGEPTLQSSINAIEKKFKIKIKKEGDAKSPRKPPSVCNSAMSTRVPNKPCDLWKVENCASIKCYSMKMRQTC